jgi:nucleoside-diphosphate-sugar epimerase
MVAQENNYKAVAVAGASGNLGSYFTDELLKNEFSVTVLVSESSKNDPLKSKRYSDWEQKGAKVVVVDY